MALHTAMYACGPAGTLRGCLLKLLATTSPGYRTLSNILERCRTIGDSHELTRVRAARHRSDMERLQRRFNVRTRCRWRRGAEPGSSNPLPRTDVGNGLFPIHSRGLPTAHLRGRERALEPFGLTGRRAEWIALASLHGGVFTRAQLSDWLGASRFKVLRLVQALTARRIATEETVRGLRVCRVCARGIYQALGAEDIRHRRITSTEVVVRRLLSFDYVIEHPGLPYVGCTSAGGGVRSRSQRGVHVGRVSDAHSLRSHRARNRTCRFPARQGPHVHPDFWGALEAPPLVRTILGGRSDANIRFRDLCALMRYLGFEERVRGSHHLFDRVGIVEIVNLQSQGGHAKPDQVRQIRRLILKYKLGAD